MSTFTLIALIGVGLWLGTLTLLQLLTVRQIGVITAKMSLGNSSAAMDFLSTDGPELGSTLPFEIGQAIPALNDRAKWMLFVSSTCTTCRQLMADLHQENADLPPFVLLVAGNAELADGLRQLAPRTAEVIVDPVAAHTAQTLRIRSTPFLLKVTDQIITNKTYVFDYQTMVKAIREDKK